MCLSLAWLQTYNGRRNCNQCQTDKVSTIDMETIISRFYQIISMIATRSAIHLVRCCHGQMSLIAVSYPIIFIHGFSFNNLVALCAEDSEIPTCCANFGMDFVGVHSRLAPISSNVSSVKTVHLRFHFLFATEPVDSNFFTISWIVNLEGGTSPGNVWIYSVRTRLGDSHLK